MVKVIKRKGIPLVEASLFELAILAAGCFLIVLNSPVVKAKLISVDYANRTELMMQLPEIKNEVIVRFVQGSFNPSELFKPYFKGHNQTDVGFYTWSFGKPLILVSINQSYDELLFTALHELGHAKWNQHLTAAERRSFCQNSFIEPLKEYAPSEWCEENFANYYARQEMVDIAAAKQ